MAKTIRIGTAGWAVPRAIAERFPEAGSGLQRYAARFNAVEINSTFRRSHMPRTWERWAASVPGHFRFSVKLPKVVSHELKLVDAQDHLLRFWEEVHVLRNKLGPVLLQLPPSLSFDPATAARFFETLAKCVPHKVVCEPRHATWFQDEADEMLGRFAIARVAADPARVPQAAQPGGSPALAYYRLHGTPRVYYSSYPNDFIRRLANAVAAPSSGEVWCIFDNTTAGAATANALTLQHLLNSFAGTLVTGRAGLPRSEVNPQ